MTNTAEQKSKVLKMKKALLDAYDPEAIILFGSLGRGDGDEFSDVDLLVVIDTEQDSKALGEEMARHLDPFATDKHVIVRTPMEFCSRKDIPGTLVFSAVNEGQVLFQKAGWQARCEITDSYETRKREVIREDYVREARDFLAKAEQSLHRGNLFRFRDFARFAAVRALKAMIVLHDVHPPRELDLLVLLEKVRSLEPDLAEYAGLLQELNDYCPARGDTREVLRCRGMLERVAAFIEEKAPKFFQKGGPE